jgi:TatD DNase family protein
MTNSPRETQKYWFKKQLALARELDLPVIIHTRDATEDTLKILKENKPEGIVHCFSGSEQVARQIIDLGLLYCLRRHPDL